jgi:hypothetical protein
MHKYTIILNKTWIVMHWLYAIILPILCNNKALLMTLALLVNCYTISLEYIVSGVFTLRIVQCKEYWLFSYCDNCLDDNCLYGNYYYNNCFNTNIILILTNKLP